MKISKIWNKLAKPKNIPRLFAGILACVLLIGFLIPTALDINQLYPRGEPQTQMDAGDSIAPYDRGGLILKEKGTTIAEYPENAASIGWINSYMSPVADAVRSISPYFGTTIYSSPGGLIDEVLYYTRGFDTILESSILMMAFIIASWLMVNFTMNRINEKDVIQKDVKKAIVSSDKIANEVEESNRKARLKQRRREG